MNKELAKRLEALVTNHKAYEALMLYLAYRVELRRNNLEHGSTFEFDKGALQELRQLEKLREHTINTLEVKDG